MLSSAVCVCGHSSHYQSCMHVSLCLGIHTGPVRIQQGAPGHKLLGRDISPDVKCSAPEANIGIQACVCRRLAVKKAWAVHLAEQQQKTSGTAGSDDEEEDVEADIDPEAVSCPSCSCCVFVVRQPSFPPTEAM